MPGTERKKISMQKYNKIMSEIIKKGKPVSDTLIEMLEEAGKYKLTAKKKVIKMESKNGKKTS